MKPKKKTSNSWKLFGIKLKSKQTAVFAFIVAVLAFYYAATRQEDKTQIDVKSIYEANEDLINHSKLFEKRIEKVVDGIYVAIGYALANMILLEGVDGIVIVDTTESPKIAREILSDFRRMTPKPLKAIILTHFHIDHIQGAKALLDDNPGMEIKVYGHSTQKWESTRFGHLGGAAYPRSFRQFGRLLDKKTENINCGIGPFLEVPTYPDYAVPSPTVTFDKNLTLTIAGLNIELYHTPGETDDHVTVWLPDKRIVLPGDNIYQAFPNLYAIRGSPPRNPHVWYKSLDFVRGLRADYMVPSHTGPLIGKKLIMDTLTAYRDAIQFVHDQTVRLMNTGLDIDDIARQVKLPPSLINHSFLQEFYGTVPWSVRGVYDLYTGWFDGDPVNLFPLSKQERALRWSELLTRGGGDNGIEMLMKYARESIQKSELNFKKEKIHLVEELQWALELASHAMRACDKCMDGKKLVIEALMYVAATAKNANARNYYLTYARELKLGLKLVVTKKDMQRLASELDLESLMSSLPYKYNPTGCDGSLRLTVAITFTNVDKTFLYQVRNCIVQYTEQPAPLPKKMDAHVRTTTDVWYAVIKEEKSGFRAYASGEIKIDGSILSFRKLISSLQM